MALNARQQTFVDEYLRCMNASEAARAAGYSEKTAYSIGDELLKKPEVAEAIARGRKARSERTQIDADRVVKELAKVALHDPRRMFADNDTVLPIRSLSDSEAAAIASFEVVEGPDGSKVKKVRFLDRTAALEKLARHLGMFRDRLELSGPNGDAIQLLVAQVQNRSTIAPVETLPAAVPSDEEAA